MPEASGHEESGARRPAQLPREPEWENGESGGHAGGHARGLPGESVDTDAEERQNLEEILGVAASALRKTLRGPGMDSAEFEELEEVFEDAVQALTAAAPTPTEARERAGAAHVARAGEPLESPHGGLTVEELTRRVEALEGQAPETAGEADGRTNPELVSILLQMLPLASNQEVTTAVARRLQHLSPREREEAIDLVRPGLLELAETLTFPVFDYVYPVVAGILRLDPNLDLAQELPRLTRTSSERAREAFWPYVVDELLRAPRPLEEMLGKNILEFVDELPPHAITRAIERLCRLPALAEGQLAQNFFDLRQRLLYRTLAHLLLSPKSDLIGPAVLSVLRTHPVRIDGARCALAASDRYLPDCAEFLHRLLLDLVTEEESAELVELSCVLLNRGLRRMDPARRQEPWVAGAVAFLGQQRFAGARSLLQMIRGQRKLGFLSAWPNECRKQARRALERLGTQGVGRG